MTCALVYHEDFNKYDLGIDHPLIGDKPRNTLRFFKEKNLLSQFTVLTPQKATEKDLLRVHDASYVAHVKALSQTGGWLSSDTPAPKGIFDIACLATGGSICAGDALFNGYACALNPLAGFHHASRGHSSGFCFFNDIAVTIEYLREKHHLKRIMIIDLDVHHGNGTQDIYYDDTTVVNLSFHQDGRTLYPGTGAAETIGRDDTAGYTVNLPLPPGTGGASYLKAFDAIVPPITKQFDPELIIYQSGVDTHHADPLADLNLTYQTYYHLATRVMTLSKETCHKLLVLFGGGYNSIHAIHSYYNIACGLLGTQTYLQEPDIPDTSPEEVAGAVDHVLSILRKYWTL
ncbi:MAG: acetoin utilization protein AcuC [Candidatus Thermoplasmatota archaeon]|nr:acetoin utilization protein AcuC [Candidatus Thermoplasmatota archaeon]